MSALLDEQYLTWLYNQVGSVKATPPVQSYWNLIRHLYKREYVWFIANDDNRVGDGLDLRHEFVHNTGIEPDEAWMHLGCSVLEMLIALSRRLSFTAGGEPREWFWRLLNNLGVGGWNDVVYKADELEEILDTFIFRSYTFDGHGGLFPLGMAEHDQRQVEVWYQMHEYLYEHGM